jgi:AbrB family looped-hinge helix DNA binding protein
MKMSKRGVITIPKEIRESLGLLPGTEVDVKLENGVVSIRPMRDLKKFDRAIKKYAGTLRTRFLADGQKSVDEFINESRGRNAAGELDVPSPFG